MLEILKIKIHDSEINFGKYKTISKINYIISNMNGAKSHKIGPKILEGHFSIIEKLKTILF